MSAEPANVVTAADLAAATPDGAPALVALARERTWSLDMRSQMLDYRARWCESEKLRIRAEGECERLRGVIEALQRQQRQ